MHDFQYKGSGLFCEKVEIETIAKDIGTPFYLYSYETIIHHFHAFDSAFAEIPHLTCFAMKANSNMAVLRALLNEGSGIDIVSGGELYRALNAGAQPDKIVFAGVGKTGMEIRYAIDADILMFNVESPQELATINRMAGQAGKKARVALRINPDVDPKTHPYISTGLKKNKFGMAIGSAIEEYKQANNMNHIEVAGVQAHIGSQITETGPFVDSLKKILIFTDKLKQEGINITYLNLGGGLGITYKDETPPPPDELAKKLVPLLNSTGYKIIFEPGRVIIGNAGILVSRVLYTKVSEKKKFLIVDGGMNDLARPALYNSYHDILPVKKILQSGEAVSDVVGPICESGDFFAKDRVIPEFKTGDLIAVMSTGAYGFSMSSNYNSRLRVAEVMVKGDKYFIVRERETHEDLVKGESVPDWL